MNDEDIKAAFRTKVEKLNKPSFSPNTTTNVPMGIVHVSPPVVKPPSEFKKVMVQWIQSKFGLLVILMLFGTLLACGQTNATTPFKYVLFRNLVVAYLVHWWSFRNKQ